MQFLFRYLLLIAATGCGTAFAVPTVVTEFGEKNYTIGDEKRSYVGQPMIRMKAFSVSKWESEVVTPTVDFTFKFTLGADRRYTAGTEMSVRGSERLRDKTYTLVEMPGIDMYQLMIDENDLFIGYVKSPHKVISAGAHVLIGASPREVQFTRKVAQRSRVNGVTMNHEIIYSGRTKDSINLLYREYTADDYARPAFSQNLTYEANSETIRFREIVMRVIEVTGDGIRFVVVEDGTPTAPPQ